MVGEYLLLQRNEAMYKLCSTSSNLEDIRIQQGYVYGLDTYLELEDALDQFKLVTEADKKRNEQMFNSTGSITSQAEAMGII